jgi:hypothetical protein
MAPQLTGAKLDIVNPVLWEIGHVGWFHEYWTELPPARMTWNRNRLSTISLRQLSAVALILLVTTTSAATASASGPF